ncbi:MAG: biopolymer transporter ExbD [Planctomycetaceae bacterium]|jgi:biopolymer transport protein ExbD|nr:biopolymer transporter ExbD [Planctomycetaceae bacterium]
MKSPDHLKPQGVSLNMTPLIDIVFQLIIFFMVTSNLVQQDVSVDIDLPAAETAKPLEENSSSSKIIINVPQEKQILLGTQAVELKDLRSVFVNWHEKYGSKSEVRIRTNKNVSYGSVEPLLVLAAESGIKDVSFAVAEKR